MTSIEALKASLAEDALRQARKYRGSTPRADNARFNVELPRSPQNMKFSTMNRSRMEALGSADFSVRSVEGEADMEGSPGETPRAHPIHRFNVNTLRDWFFDIDTDRSGSITQRELIVALRQHKGMQALFCQISGVEEEVGVCHQSSVGPAAAKARREEVTRIKRILDEIDTDGSGTMEWIEFVEFFRRTGLLLEYQTRDSLNNADSLMTAEELAQLEAANERQEKEEDERKCQRHGMSLAPGHAAALKGELFRRDAASSEDDSSAEGS